MQKTALSPTVRRAWYDFTSTVGLICSVVRQVYYLWGLTQLCDADRPMSTLTGPLHPVNNDYFVKSFTAPMVPDLMIWGPSPVWSRPQRAVLMNFCTSILPVSIIIASSGWILLDNLSGTAPVRAVMMDGEVTKEVRLRFRIPTLTVTLIYLIHTRLMPEPEIGPVPYFRDVPCCRWYVREVPNRHLFLLLGINRRDVYPSGQ
ncbi:MAG: hypothetical protein IPJ06_19560 [Saprospiraceae bacterium]|nr:hypothetical protein [Saprospiraceae bacterium]